MSVDLHLTKVITRTSELLVNNFDISDICISDHLAIRCKLLRDKHRPTKTLVTSCSLRAKTVRMAFTVILKIVKVMMTITLFLNLLA